MRSPHPGPLVKSALIFAFVLILMLLAFAGPLREASVANPEDEYLSNSGFTRVTPICCLESGWHHALVPVLLATRSNVYIAGLLALYLLCLALIAMMLARPSWFSRSKNLLLDELHFEQLVSDIFADLVNRSSNQVDTIVEQGTNEAIDLCISDAGVGFDPELAKEKAGLGLISMRERLRLVGGQLFVESEPFHGTKICPRVPLLGRIPGETDSTSRVTTAEDREVPHA